jgi:hypothetical protein
MNSQSTLPLREHGRPICCSAASCVRPAWAGTKRGSSPLYIEMMKQNTTRSQLRKGDRPWGGRLWESHQAMNKNLLRGRRRRVSWHNAAKPVISTPEVKEALGWRRFPSLSGETSLACGSPSGFSAAPSNGRRDRRGVSRGHSNGAKNREDERSLINDETRQRDPMKDRTNHGAPTRGPYPPQRTRPGK